MRTIGKYFLGIKRFPVLVIFFSISSPTVLSAISVPLPRHGQAFGIAWRVKGSWKSDGPGRIIADGDAILPGTLVHPVQASGSHSLLILLPDGQRILYECFLAEDCAHSFRVPALYRTPEPSAIDLIERIHQVLSGRVHDESSGDGQDHALPRDEVLAVLDSAHQVEIGGLASALPNAEYTYSLRPLSPKLSPQSGITLRKRSRLITLKLPAPGLYDLTVVDRLGTPRIDLFIAAAGPNHQAAFSKSFAKAHALLADWNEDYQGWPVHEFQRAYLESLFSNFRPNPEYSRQAPIATHGAPDTTSEPSFSPAPGLYKNDTAVTLASKTPGAVLHYTVDGSQPLSSSPIYNAPVMVKGTALTIRAFASAPGKKDSVVVTGIFRIRD